MMFEFAEENGLLNTDRLADIKVVGVGGAGGNAVGRMIEAGLVGVEFFAVNTDLQALHDSTAHRTLQIGAQRTKGLGSGGNPSVGRAAAEEDLEQIREALNGADMVFVTAGMGGGTGTGAAPVIAQVARELGALTVAIVTKPFRFEASVRMQQALSGIEELRRSVDTLIIIPNQRLLEVVPAGTSMREAFRIADNVLYEATRGIYEIISRHDHVNLDFADVRTVMKDMGQAMMGTGRAEGPNRAVEAARQAISSPLLENVNILGSRAVLVNVLGREVGLQDTAEAMEFIQDAAGPQAHVIFGYGNDESMGDQLQLTVIATGFDVVSTSEEVAAAQARLAASLATQAGATGEDDDLTPVAETEVTWSEDTWSGDDGDVVTDELTDELADELTDELVDEAFDQAAAAEAAAIAAAADEARRREEEELLELEEQLRQLEEEEALAAEEARLQAEEEARLAAEAEEARRQAAEDARLAAEAEEARLQAAETARLAAEAEDARRLAQAQALREAEQARERAEQEARMAGEMAAIADARRLAAEDEIRQRAEQEALDRADYEVRLREEMEARVREELEARLREEYEARIREEQRQRELDEQEALELAAQEARLAKELTRDWDENPDDDQGDDQGDGRFAELPEPEPRQHESIIARDPEPTPSPAPAPAKSGWSLLQAMKRVQGRVPQDVDGFLARDQVAGGEPRTPAHVDAPTPNERPTKPTNSGTSGFLTPVGTRGIGEVDVPDGGSVQAVTRSAAAGIGPDHPNADLSQPAYTRKYMD
jgi:cell division protein FtsZ